MSAERVKTELELDRDVVNPLHQQIQVGLEHSIRSGKLTEGDRLPNIMEISRLLNVSHATALKAITALQRKGLLISKRGVGTIVAPMRVGSTDIIMPSRGGHEVGGEGWQFHHQLLDGLKEGFGEPDRSITLMYMGGVLCSPGEFLASLHARRVDSVIAYRPPANLHPLLKAAGREMPVVSLFYYIPDAPAHCVSPDVDSGMREMIDRRLRAGVRDFAYVDYGQSYETKSISEPFNPYTSLHRVFRDVLKNADVNYTEHTIDPDRLRDKGKTADLRGQDGKPLKPGTVILINTPRVYQFLGGLADSCDVIFYTEFGMRLEQFRGKASIIYFGLGMAARAAAELIMNRDALTTGEGSRTVLRPAAKVYDRFKP